MRHLPTPADMAGRWDLSKPLPRVLSKAEKAKTKKQAEAEFRAAVWARDNGCSRASRKPLVKSWTTDWRRIGEVHHVLARSTDPDKRLDPSNGILLSKEEHALAETSCPNDPAHCLLEILGPKDRSRPQIFVWRDVHGQEVRRRRE